MRRPRLFFRSELWIALLGPSVEEGIVGIGSTVMAALRAFDAQYLAGLRPPSETVGTASTLQADSVARRPSRRRKSSAKSRAEVSVPASRPGRAAESFLHDRYRIVMRTHQLQRINEGERSMEAIRPKRDRWRTLKFKRRSRKLSKCSGTLQPETMDNNGSAEPEETDRLLVSALRFWEVEHDLIEERLAAIGR